MPTWTYTGDAERVFPEQGITLAPGDNLDAEECPDPQFFTEGKAREKVKDPDPEPAAAVDGA